MDHFIEHVVKAQRADGYIHTPVIIEEKNKGIDTHSDKQQQTVIGTKVGGEDEKGAFANRLNFETYNLGHLMMAGIIHRCRFPPFHGYQSDSWKVPDNGDSL